jgi:hypothetical protein
MRAAITIDAYETAERELLLARARRVLRRHAVALATAAVVLVLGELFLDGAPWLAYLAVSVWAFGVAVYYRGWFATRRRTHPRAAVPGRVAGRSLQRAPDSANVSSLGRSDDARTATTRRRQL